MRGDSPLSVKCRVCERVVSLADVVYQLRLKNRDMRGNRRSFIDNRGY